MEITSPTKRDLPTVQKIEPTKIFCNAIVEQGIDEWPTGVSPETRAGIWLVDRDMQVVWMNEQMERIYGSLDQLRGKNCFAGFRGRSSKCPDCLPEQAFNTGKTKGTPSKFSDGSGTLF